MRYSRMNVIGNTDADYVASTVALISQSLSELHEINMSANHCIDITQAGAYLGGTLAVPPPLGRQDRIISIE